MTFAVIPAAGKSTRMGRSKLALPLGGKTVLERVVGSLAQGGVEHVLVVVGPNDSPVSALAKESGAYVVQLTHDTADMRGTVEKGLDWLEERFHPQPESNWLLVPADHPALDEEVVRSLIRAKLEQPKSSVIVPLHGGQRGHPVLIAWKHRSRIKDMPMGQGLNILLRELAIETLELPVDSPGVLWDLDTPDDYRRLQHIWDSRS